MKIVCVSDTHGYYPQNIPDGDIFIHAGDITKFGKENELYTLNRWLGALPHKHKIIIAGNHDICFERMRAVSEKVVTAATYLQNSSIVIDGIKFYGSPYQPRFFEWAFNLDGPALEACWAEIPDDTDVLITHGPPKHVLDKNLQGENCGCELLHWRVKQIKPNHHIFGHIHQSHGEMYESGIHFVNASLLNDHYRPVFLPIVFETN